MTNKPRFYQMGLLCLFAVSSFSFFFTPNLFSFEADKNSDLYKSALLMEAKTGKILFEDRANDPIIPASIVKMMTSLIALEAIDNGSVKLTDKVTVSRWVSQIGGHQVYLKEGEVFTMEELMKAVVIGSANDAAAAVAEYIGGNQATFVGIMNQRAQDLKMKNTHFYNSHGLPPGKGQKENFSTAYDLALLAQETLKHAQYLVWSNTLHAKFRNGTFDLLNTNFQLLRKMPNVDGLKTGFYNRAGFSVVATAKRGKIRLISVVIGSKYERVRTQTTSHLLTKGFVEFGHVKVLEKGIQLGSPLPVKNGKAESVSLLTDDAVELFLKYSDKSKIKQHFNLPRSINAPVLQGMIVGSVELRLHDQVLQTVNLISANNVQAKTLWGQIKDMIKEKTSTF